VVYLESGFPPQTSLDLEAQGQRSGIFGGYQAVMWDNKREVCLGASESRKDGHAAGYWTKLA